MAVLPNLCLQPLSYSGYAMAVSCFGSGYDLHYLAGPKQRDFGQHKTNECPGLWVFTGPFSEGVQPKGIFNLSSEALTPIGQSLKEVIGAIQSPVNLQPYIVGMGPEVALMDNEKAGLAPRTTWFNTKGNGYLCQQP
ncbi:hypothetical protein B0H10DRAFT_1943435 [Mycena sp. CBHHK59/15]|nr:hypothetical protein B0H10DRAFT_1943435 [Mycena sp. CBHHK59/15]